MKKIFFLILIILGLTACKKAAFDIVNIDAPFISTDSVKNIKIDSATVYFNINNPSNVKFNKVGICFDTITNNPNINNMVQLTDSGAVKGILKISLANLKINTKYYVRCFAIFNDSIFYGNVQTFTTNRLPTISLSINNITNSTANIHLGITNIEKTNFTKIGVYYSTTNMLPGTSNNDSSKILNNTGALSGTYILNLNNLVAGNIYYIRYFYVINGVQYISTQVQNFTAIILPMVQTDTANNITNSNATLNFSISNVAALNITAAGIAYSSSNSTPTTIHGYVALSSIGNLAGNYTINLSSLTANTLYYYRAYINYNGTIYYGSVRSFTTVAQNGLPTNGLITYWSFNGNTNDLSGNNNFGTIMNNYNYTTDRKGNTSAALNLLTSNSSMISNVTFNNPQIFTVSLWIKTTNTTKLFSSVLYSSGYVKDTSKKIIYFASNNQYDRSLNIYKDLIEVYYHDDGGGYFYINKAANLDDLNWHHIVYTLNQNGSNINIDGTKILNSAQNFAQSFNGKWILGSLYNVNFGTSLNNAFIGLYDDIRIYNRVLTDNEILSLFNE